MKRDFDDIMSTLKETIASYDYFTDFEKAYKNVDSLEKELDALSSLIGKKDDFDALFIKLLDEKPSVVKALPMLLALRRKNNLVPVYDNGTKLYNFNKKENSNEEYLKFVKETGIKELLINSKIRNLYDYVLGVEVGLDSNARKNRTGKAMEDIVYDYLSKIPNATVLKQATKKEIKEVFGTDALDNLNLKEGNNQAEKRFDFAVKVKDKISLVETNFYGTGGSKLNEVARSYEKLADEINKLGNIQFVWITDGQGRLSAKYNLHESYGHQKHLITLFDFENNPYLNIFK